MTDEKRKIAAEALSVAILLGGTAFAINSDNMATKIPETLDDDVTEFQDDTMLDELSKENIATYNDMTIIEAADLLEEKIAIVKLLNRRHYNKEMLNITEKEIKEVENLSLEDINLLVVFSEDEETKRVLNVANNYNKKWLEENAKEIALKTLEWSLKSSVASGLDITEQDIEEVSMGHKKNKQDDHTYITYKEHDYKVKFGQGRIQNVISCYYQIINSDQKTETDYYLYKDAVNSAKILTMTGIENENGRLKSKREFREAQKVLKK